MSETGTRDHERYMRLALAEAARARSAGEVPVGAVVVIGDAVVGRGHNASLTLSDPTAHAEVLAIRDAASRIGNYRLVGATLYCTVEPCLMCLGAIMQARVATVVWGAPDLKVGATGRLQALRATGADFNHRFETIGGILAEPASTLLLEFFRERRALSDEDEGQERPADRDCGEVPKWS